MVSYGCYFITRCCWCLFVDGCLFLIIDLRLLVGFLLGGFALCGFDCLGVFCCWFVSWFGFWVLLCWILY